MVKLSSGVWSAVIAQNIQQDVDAPRSDQADIYGDLVNLWDDL